MAFFAGIDLRAFAELAPVRRTMPSGKVLSRSVLPEFLPRFGGILARAGAHPSMIGSRRCFE
ncbi:hypothetical protein ASF25_11780 [Methylobacterium sp. Leaf100]|nr:hypothetical protein ASF25_11780 [Methylobacterium sp. Leaf100]